MAGVPFDAIERLGTLETSRAARLVLACKSDLLAARSEAEKLLAHRDNGLSPETHGAFRGALKARPAALPENAHPKYASLVRAISAHAKAEINFTATLNEELNFVRRSLLDVSRDILPRYLVFGAPGTRDLLIEAMHANALELPPRNKRARERERHLLLYLQRIAAKNDTFSEFGPSAWGRAGPDVTGLSLAPEPGVQRREAFMERWTAHAVAAAMNSDSAVKEELAPRLHPNGRLEGNTFVSCETGGTIQLTRETSEFLRQSNGEIPAYACSLSLAELTDLAAKEIILWQVEVPALDPYAFSHLLADVGAWRAGATRQRWLEILQPLEESSARLAGTPAVPNRAGALEEARTRLSGLGIERAHGERFLYAALNPIGEECFRECHFLIEDKLLQEIPTEAAPWIDFWRDCYAYIASRVAAGLRGLLETAPLQNGGLSLPAFLRHCHERKMPLTGPGMIALAHIAFQEVKAAFRERFKDRPDATEWEFTAADSRLIRENFEFEPFDEYTFPSADIQLSAVSREAVARGEYQWILSELHPPPAILHHGGYWSCPDHAELSRALASMTFGHPSFHFGFFAADFTSHTVVHAMDALSELTNFVAPQRGNPHWRVTPPAECEVFAQHSSGDVCLRKRVSHEYLGSFARAWLIPLGFHPFQFGRPPHMPRLRCGQVIVQRQSWTVTLEELPAGDYTGISRDLVLAVEGLRATKDWPRYIYVRPTEQALRRSGAEGRDKDTKPVFIDLESYLSLEIFHRWLVKAGELEVTEMLPDPDHLCWQEADGRRTFELRTLIVPRS
jgi:hypothetical protein